MRTAAQMGYSENEFLLMTPRFFANAIDGYEARQRDEWERTRLLSWYAAVGPHLDPKKLEKSPQKFMPLPWDKKQAKIVPMTGEQIAEIQRVQIEKLNRARLEKAARSGNNSGS